MGSFNRIFGTGYHPVGIGSGQGYRDVKVTANYIQMQGTSPADRWRGGVGGGDPAGQLCTVNGIRLQKPRGNIELSDNVIVIRGSGRNRWMRGLWLVPGDEGNETLAIRNNRVKVIAEDKEADGHALAAGGVRGGRPTPVTLSGNTLITNLCHVQFGDNYSHGGRHVFSGNRFVRVGDDPRYRTARLGWRGWKYETHGHVFADSAFEGGASVESVSFDGTRSGRFDFAVAWSLEVSTLPGAAVAIRDSTGEQVFSGKAPPDGKLTVPLTQYVRTRSGKASRTPHSVTVEHNGKKTTRAVTMDKRQSIQMRLSR